ncbi:alpha/beta fold hydrolase [Haloferacaceae archaeon DSL9]
MSDLDRRPSIPAGVPGESVFVDTNGVRLHAIRAGPEDGPLVVLLHGFPEFWYGWHESIRPLAEEGFHVVVPDQRGYNLSDKPDGVSAYHIDELTADVVGLLDELGYDEAAIAGHDWGAAVAWWTALHHPERVRRLCAVNVPHPTVMRKTLRRSWDQRFRSWYVLGFQVPYLPEAVARARNWDLLARSMCESSLPGTFAQTDLEYYREAWSQPGAFTAMINWYRAMVRNRPRPRRERVSVPTLVLWGAHDQFLKKSMARASVDMCDDGRLVMFHDATHWVLHEEPIRATTELLDFLRDGPRVPRQ